MGFWDDEKERKTFFIEIANQLYFDPLRADPWYSVPDEVILNKKVYFSTSSINLVDSNNLKSAVLYINADEDKEKIVNENRHKSGIYQ